MPNDLAVSLSSEAGAPEAEIAVTPEMIEAGVMAFLRFDSRFESECDAVVEIYVAMMNAKVAGCA